MKISKKTIIFAILTVFFVVADRFLKALAIKGLLDQPIPVFGNVFSLHFIKNYYISFSIPLSGPILTAFIGLIIAILFFYLLKSFLRQGDKSSTTNLRLSMIFLLTGAILNLTDRLKFGYVIDYFDLKYFTVFNIADCLICAGVIWLFFLVKKEKRS